MFVVPVTRTIGKSLTDADAYSQRYTSTHSADVAEDRVRDTAVREDSGGAARGRLAGGSLPPTGRLRCQEAAVSPGTCHDPPCIRV